MKVFKWAIIAIVIIVAIWAVSRGCTKKAAVAVPAVSTGTVVTTPAPAVK